MTTSAAVLPPGSSSRTSVCQQTFSAQMPLIQPINDDDKNNGFPPVTARKKESIQQKFNRFHDRNPLVYHIIVDIANRMKLAGVHKFGMKGIFEYLRWQYSMQTQGEQYKLNNVFTALYARMIMEREAGLRGFFETRKRLAE